MIAELLAEVCPTKLLIVLRLLESIQKDTCLSIMGLEHWKGKVFTFCWSGIEGTEFEVWKTSKVKITMLSFKFEQTLVTS